MLYFASGSKVEQKKVSPLYTLMVHLMNSFSISRRTRWYLKTSDLRAVSKIPFSIVAVQSEVPSKDTPMVTQGSQITKLATMDFLNWCTS
jgi:hypothetical protein